MYNIHFLCLFEKSNNDAKEAVTAYRVGHLTLDYYIKDYVMIIVLWYTVSQYDHWLNNNTNLYDSWWFVWNKNKNKFMFDQFGLENTFIVFV